MRVLVTGGCGLVGFECAALAAERGDDVTVLDNFGRGHLLGAGASTQPMLARLRREHPAVRFVELDVREIDTRPDLVEGVDLVIHAAAQPSHPRSIEIPLEDFSVNAHGTLLLLEAVRAHAPRAVFVHCSTNKVYGDRPNAIPTVELETRHDYADGGGVDESMPLDQSKHTPFGVSKVAADLYAQEYARLYGLQTGVFRMGCITGPKAAAVEAHNWEPFFVRKVLAGEPLTIYGFRGKQVRDVIHARDLAAAFLRFAAAPRPGAVYNMGGGRANSISLLEALALIERLTGRKALWEHGPEREGDHKVYISDLTRFERDYGPANTYTLERIFAEIVAELAR